jgi:hypothetical protein
MPLRCPPKPTTLSLSSPGPRAHHLLTEPSGVLGKAEHSKSGPWAEAGIRVTAAFRIGRTRGFKWKLDASRP